MCCAHSARHIIKFIVLVNQRQCCGRLLYCRFVVTVLHTPFTQPQRQPLRGFTCCCLSVGWPCSSHPCNNTKPEQRRPQHCKHIYTSSGTGQARVRGRSSTVRAHVRTYRIRTICLCQQRFVAIAVAAAWAAYFAHGALRQHTTHTYTYTARRGECNDRMPITRTRTTAHAIGRGGCGADVRCHRGLSLRLCANVHVHCNLRPT